MKGRLITIYGVNNMGKSTHAKRLVKKLNEEGIKAKYVKYPVYDIEPSGPFLNAVLRGGSQEISEAELQTWFVVNRYQFEPQLKKWLEEGYTVIAEDYIGTGMAWGMTKGMEEEYLEHLNEKLLEEDLAILMVGDRDKRAVEKGHVHEEDDNLVEKCYENFLKLGEKKRWTKVKLQDKISSTAELIWEVVSKFLHQ